MNMRVLIKKKQQLFKYYLTVQLLSIQQASLGEE